MNLIAAWRRFSHLDRSEQRYYLRKFFDLYMHHRSGFSHFGEDASMLEYLRTVGSTRISYLDIGANHPVIHSNTYLFYRAGASGVLVDANPRICRHLRRKRPRDVVVNHGVAGEHRGKQVLHLMDLDGLSTLSADWGKHLKEQGLASEVDNVTVEVLGINELLAAYFPALGPTIVSLDVEGIDFEVIEAWDFTRWRPPLMCVETGALTKGRYVKDERFTFTMRARGYRPLFETFANTVYVRED